MSDRLTGGPVAGFTGSRTGGAVYAAVLCLVVLAASGAIGLAAREPWLFPSLGPTVMMFFQSPQQPAARPVNVFVGHGIGLVVGFACAAAFVPASSPSVVDGGLTAGYLVAAPLSVALTTAALTVLRLPHPPAGATTLIVSLGILRQPPQLLVMAGAVLLVTLLGWALDRTLLGRRTRG